VGPGAGQLGRLPYTGDPSALDQDRGAGDDPPLTIDGDGVAGVVDFQAGLWHHAVAPSARYRGDGSGASAFSITARAARRPTPRPSSFISNSGAWCGARRP